ALLFASAPIAEKLGASTTLAALGAGALMAEGIASGHAHGESAIGPLAIERMGSGGATVLVATLEGGSRSEPAASAFEVEAKRDEFSAEPANLASPVAATLADVGAALLAPPEPAEPAPRTGPEASTPA